MPVDVLLVLEETAVLGVTYSFCELKEAFSPTRERDIAFNTPLRPAILANTTHTLSPRASACSLDNIIGGLAEAVDHSDTAIFADGDNRTCQEPESSAIILVEISYIQHDAFDQSPKFLTDQTLVRSKSVLHPDAYIGHI